MSETFKRLTTSAAFQRFILALILISGILAGVESYKSFDASTSAGRTIVLIQNVIVWIFLVEIILKVLACGSRPWEYFKAPWNIFDFSIVALCFLPLGTRYTMVFRMARLLRALRMVTLLPRLQVLVGALLKSIPSLGYVGILLALHFYMYAVAGTFFFRDNDPLRFGSLHVSTLTLFQVLTLEGWNDIMSTAYLGSDVAYDDAWKEVAGPGRISQGRPILASIYFVSFIMLGTMIMLNLFTGVIISSMEEAQNEAAEDARRRHMKNRGFLTLHDELTLLGQQLTEIAGQMQALRAHIVDIELYTTQDEMRKQMPLLTQEHMDKPQRETTL